MTSLTPVLSMTRRLCLCLLLASSFLAVFAHHAHASGAKSAAKKSIRKPNVVIVFTDDQRPDTIAALGNSHIKTPNMDRLVKNGVTFTHAYCMGSGGGAVCVPSRAMLLSGRTLFHVSSNMKGVVSWPEMFARAGYLTFYTGKWHNQENALLQSFIQGRNVFLGGMGNPYALPVTSVTDKRQLTKRMKSPKHSCELFTDSAVDFIKNHNKKDPFLAMVVYNLPHDPRVAPKKYHDYYNKNKPPLPSNYMPVHPFNNGELVVRDEKLAPWPRTKDVVRQHLADYYACITFIDDQLGRILKALEDTGELDNTIIVFVSDHGLAIGSHGLFGKQNLYDHSMRSPLIMSGPGLPKDRKVDGLCYLLDIYPTLGALTGIQAPPGSEGISLLPGLEGHKLRDSIFLAYRNVQRAVRDDRWKLIVYPQINKTQLFDLKSDPDEMKDLSAARPDEVKRLTKLLQTNQQRLGDTQSLTSVNPQPQEFDFSRFQPKKKNKNKK